MKNKKQKTLRLILISFAFISLVTSFYFLSYTYAWLSGSGEESNNFVFDKLNVEVKANSLHVSIIKLNDLVYVDFDDYYKFDGEKRVETETYLNINEIATSVTINIKNISNVTSRTYISQIKTVSGTTIRNEGVNELIYVFASKQYIRSFYQDGRVDNSIYDYTENIWYIDQPLRNGILGEEDKVNGEWVLDPNQPVYDILTDEWYIDQAKPDGILGEEDKMDGSWVLSDIQGDNVINSIFDEETGYWYIDQAVRNGRLGEEDKVNGEWVLDTNTFHIYNEETNKWYLDLDTPDGILDDIDKIDGVFVRNYDIHVVYDAARDTFYDDQPVRNGVLDDYDKVNGAWVKALEQDGTTPYSINFNGIWYIDQPLYNYTLGIEDRVQVNGNYRSILETILASNYKGETLKEKIAAYNTQYLKEIYEQQLLSKNQEISIEVAIWGDYNNLSPMQKEYYLSSDISYNLLLEIKAIQKENINPNYETDGDLR